MPAAVVIEVQAPATRLKKLFAFELRVTTEDAKAVEAEEMVLTGPELPSVFPSTHKAGKVAIFARVTAPADMEELATVPIRPL